MEEEIDPLLAFGRQVLPLQWFSVTNPDDMSEVIVGLQSTSSEPLRSGEVIYNISSIAPDDELISLIEAIEFNTNLEASQQFSVDTQEIQLPGAIEYQFDVQSLADIAQGEAVAAFNVNYADLSVGGGSVTIELPPSFLSLPGSDDPNTAPIVVTTSMPRFNELEIDDGVREFWGGTFIEADTTHYVAQENFYDEVVLPGLARDYTLSIDGNGTVVVTVINPLSSLYGKQYTVENAESVIFGDVPSDINEALDVIKFYNLLTLSREEIQQIAQTHAVKFGTIPTIDDLAKLATNFVIAGQSDQVALEDSNEESNYFAPFRDVDFQNERNSETLSDFVDGFYDLSVNRSADVPGKSFWETALFSGAIEKEDFATEFYRGILAESGGADDKAYLASVWQLTIDAVIEGGITDADVLAEFECQFRSDWDLGVRDTEFEYVETVLQEAQNGDGTDDLFTIQVLGILDDIAESGAGF